MKSKLVIVLALVGFSTSVFAQKATISKEKVEAKAKDSKERVERKEISERELTQELLKDAQSSLKPENIDAGLEAQFGSKLPEKLEFRARLSTASTSGDPVQKRFAEVTMQLLGKLGSYKPDSSFANTAAKKAEMEKVVAVVKTILKNIELTSMNEAVEKYMNQVDAVNHLLYSKYSSKTKAEDSAKLTAEYIELVGILNVRKADFGLASDGVILSLEKLSKEQIKKLEELLETYRKDC